FLIWITAVLKLTRVSYNEILLALLFVYRLRKWNPTVPGQPGSQYRVFTVALILANKYNNDKWYANKLWAEASGISVEEIQIMEKEFLSNIQYLLYVPQSEWLSW
ncbi:hypothetical protein BZA77DRAFT_224746, partial [Pyronema omphalodes]